MAKDKSLSSKVLDIFTGFVCILVVVMTLYPVLHLAALSFSSFNAVTRGLVSIWPVEFTLTTYSIIWKAGTIPTAFVNSLWYMTLGTLINMAVTTPMAYAMSKKRLPMKGFYKVLVLVPMFFSGGLIPTFLTIKSYNIFNTVWALVLPGAVSTYNLIIMRTFFSAQPESLEESAFLDGASDLQVFWRIVLPTSQAALATVSLFYMVGHWNAWFAPMIYLSDSRKFPMQLVLRNIVIQGQLNQEMAAQGLLIHDSFAETSTTSIKYGTLFLSIVPMMIIYPFIQKYFTKGVMLGSLKE